MPILKDMFFNLQFVPTLIIRPFEYHAGADLCHERDQPVNDCGAHTRNVVNITPNMTWGWDQPAYVSAEPLANLVSLGSCVLHKLYP